MSQDVIFMSVISTIFQLQFFVQWIDLGSKNPLLVAHSGYQDTTISGTKVCGGSMDFNLGRPWHKKKTHLQISLKKKLQQQKY